MSKSRLKKVSLPEFIAVLSEAQKHHAFKREPIPEVSNNEHFQIVNCLNSPFQLFSNKALYPGIHKKAAMLFYLLIKNHPLKNGNKRMAILTTWWFFRKNRYDLRLESRAMNLLERANDSDSFIYRLSMMTANSLSDNKDEVLLKIEKAFMKRAKHLKN